MLHDFRFHISPIVKSMVLEGYWELELQLQNLAGRRPSTRRVQTVFSGLSACAHNPPRRGVTFLQDLSPIQDSVTCLAEADHHVNCV